MLKYNSGSLLLSKMKDKNNSLKMEQSADRQEQDKQEERRQGEEEKR